MNVLICDDQALIRDSLGMLLNLERDIRVVGAAEDGAQAVDMVIEHQPDLVLMDLKMPGMNGIEATRRIRTRYPAVKVLVLTTYDDDEWVFDAIRAGASGYLLKDTPREDVIKAVRGTVEGRSFLDPAVAGKLIGQVASQQTQPATLHHRQADRARGRRAAPAGARLHQRRHRRPTASLRGDRAQPRQRHLRQAGRLRPHASGRDRYSAWSG